MHHRHSRVGLPDLDPQLLDGQLRRGEALGRRLKALGELRRFPGLAIQQLRDAARAGERAGHAYSGVSSGSTTSTRRPRTMPRMARSDKRARFPVHGADVGNSLRRVPHDTRPVDKETLVERLLAPPGHRLLHHLAQVLGEVGDLHAIVGVPDEVLDGHPPAAAAYNDRPVLRALDHVVEVILV